MSSSTLHNIQNAFSNSLFDRTDTRILASVNGKADGIKNKRLDIYRNNIFYSLSSALADLYPVIKRLVGPEFFRATAIEYIRLYPPRQAAMVRLAEDFPEFLQSFEHTSRLAYLTDVARVELAWHQAYHADDAVSLQARDLSKIAPDHLARSRFELHPSVRLVESLFPVFQIWCANQPGQESDEVIDLDSGGVTLCACRPGYDVLLHELDPAVYTLLQVLKQGGRLEAAMTAAGEVKSSLSAAEIFGFCIHAGFLSEITGN